MILIVDLNRRGGLQPLEYVAPIAYVVGGHTGYTVKHYSDVTLEAAVKHNAVILSGTPLKDTGCLDNMDSFKWLLEYGKPVLGVCAGMQVLCMLYGSSLTDCKEIGMIDVETAGENPLFTGSFRAYAIHRRAVEPSDSFTVLARSDRCVQAVKHRNNEHYGVLFHPEVRNPGVLDNFIRL